MAFGAAHLAELGLRRWRLRGSEPAAPVAFDAGPELAPELAAAPRVAASVHVPEARLAPSAPVQPAKEKRVPESESVSTRSADDLARIAGMSWDELESFVKAQSRGDARQAVFGVGVRDADVLVIGEAPGADEDEQGEPFVGRAGQLLDEMLRAVGLSRQSNVYIANICKFRPPNNRDPLPAEIAEDWPYLQRQIALIQPRILLAVGRIAAQTLLELSDPIGRMRGKAHHYGADGLPVVVTYHPAYLLRSPREKAKSWQDLKRLRDVLLAT